MSELDKALTRLAEAERLLREAISITEDRWMASGYLTGVERVHRDLIDAFLSAPTASSEAEESKPYELKTDTRADCYRVEFWERGELVFLHECVPATAPQGEKACGECVGGRWVGSNGVDHRCPACSGTGRVTEGWR